MAQVNFVSELDPSQMCVRQEPLTLEGQASIVTSYVQQLMILECDKMSNDFSFRTSYRSKARNACHLYFFAAGCFCHVCLLLLSCQVGSAWRDRGPCRGDSFEHLSNLCYSK